MEEYVGIIANDDVLFRSSMSDEGERISGIMAFNTEDYGRGFPICNEAIRLATLDTPGFWNPLGTRGERPMMMKQQRASDVNSRALRIARKEGFTSCQGHTHLYDIWPRYRVGCIHNHRISRILVFQPSSVPVKGGQVCTSAKARIPGYRYVEANPRPDYSEDHYQALQTGEGSTAAGSGLTEVERREGL